MELRNYTNEAMEVKEVLISLERLRCRRCVSPHMLRESGALIIDDLRRCTESDILDDIRKYIKVKEIDPCTVEAELCLPYIYDDAMKTKDRDIDRLQADVSRQRRAAFDAVETNKRLMKRNLWQRILNK